MTTFLLKTSPFQIVEHSKHVYIIFYCECNFHVECRRYFEHVLKIAFENSFFFKDWHRELITLMLQIV